VCGKGQQDFCRFVFLMSSDDHNHLAYLITDLLYPMIKLESLQLLRYGARFDGLRKLNVMLDIEVYDTLVRVWNMIRCVGSLAVHTPFLKIIRWT
jgi:hypothetical protein